ncbi:MAG: spore cortex biosynthesis protein YabQ [Firmicutes bacterium]|nr:spore cortex biosynthesis protein YabQ [Bacillota bacterium]
MILSFSEQAKLFLSTVCIGCIIGFVYDIIRVFRGIIKHPEILKQAEDLLYWTISAISVFILLLSENNGEVRFFMIIGSFIGIILYYLTLSSLFIKVSMKVYEFIKKIISVFIEIVMTPFRLLLIPLRYIFKKLINILKILKKLLKKYLKCVRINNRFLFLNRFKEKLKIIFSFASGVKDKKDDTDEKRCH